MKLIQCVLIILCISCVNKKKQGVATMSPALKVVLQKKQCPLVISKTIDTSLLLVAIRNQLSIPEGANENERISECKKVKIFGSQSENVLVEYSFADRSNAEYPYKYQILFDSKGYPIQLFHVNSLKEIVIQPKQNPFLLANIYSYSLQGYHVLYCFRNDSLVQVYDGFVKDFLWTIDGYMDYTAFEPYELQVKSIDVNNDGYNDLQFYGTMEYVKDSVTPGAKHYFKPIQYDYLFVKETGRFTKQK